MKKWVITFTRQDRWCNNNNKRSGAEGRRITNLMANQRRRWWFNNKSSTRFYSHSIASHSITHEFFLFPFFHFSIFFSFFFLSQQFYLREGKRKITNKKCRSVYSSIVIEWVSEFAIGARWCRAGGWAGLEKTQSRGKCHITFTKKSISRRGRLTPMPPPPPASFVADHSRSLEEFWFNRISFFFW